jgi:hypothetical protein
LIFGRYVWDTALLPAYEGLRLYTVWPLWVAAGIALAVWYVVSRQFWWRYALNRLALAIADQMMGWDWAERAYVWWRRWMSGWYPALLARGLGWLPAALRSSAFAAAQPDLLNGYLPPNRRYLVLVRSRIDIALHRWRYSLLSRRWDGVASPGREWYAQVFAALRTQRRRWNDHQQLNLADKIIQPEPAASAAILALEQLGVATSHRRLTDDSMEAALVAALEDELRSEVHCAFDILGKTMPQVAVLQTAVAAIYQFDGSYERLVALLELCSETVVAGGANVWTLALAEQIVTCAIERLVAYRYVQEAIEISYAADTGPTLAQAERRAMKDLDSVGGPEKVGLFGRLLRDVSVEEPIWSVTLARPAADTWRAALLAEAWHALSASLAELFAETRAAQTRMMLGGRAAMDENVVAEIHRGYLIHVAGEVEAAAHASESPAIAEHARLSENMLTAEEIHAAV